MTPLSFSPILLQDRARGYGYRSFGFCNAG